MPPAGRVPHVRAGPVLTSRADRSARHSGNPARLPDHYVASSRWCPGANSPRYGCCVLRRWRTHAGRLWEAHDAHTVPSAAGRVDRQFGDWAGMFRSGQHAAGCPVSGVSVRIFHRPPGFGAVLASARPVPWRQRLVITGLGALFYAAVMAYVLWQGLSWRWTAATLGPTYALVIWMTSRNIVRAGEGWLSKGRNCVRTDRLTVLQAEGTLTGVRFMMRDVDSRSVHFRPSDISANPDVWQLARAGILASCSAGLIIDAPTSHYFALQGSLQTLRKSHGGPRRPSARHPSSSGLHAAGRVMLTLAARV
jgi:hypothetical protein